MTNNDEFDVSNENEISKSLTNTLEKNKRNLDYWGILSIPFIFIDYILILLKIITLGIVYLPAYVNILMFTPLSIIIIFNYVLPLIRGN